VNHTEGGLIKYIRELNDRIFVYACHCVERYTFAELVDYAKDGIDGLACHEWGLSGEEWQDAIFAALKELRILERRV
jgi:hypothetical protein